jgi:hypothetical protein
MQIRLKTKRLNTFKELLLDLSYLVGNLLPPRSNLAKNTLLFRRQSFQWHLTSTHKTYRSSRLTQSALNITRQVASTTQHNIANTPKLRLLTQQTSKPSLQTQLFNITTPQKLLQSQIHNPIKRYTILPAKMPNQRIQLPPKTHTPNSHGKATPSAAMLNVATFENAPTGLVLRHFRLNKQSSAFKPNVKHCISADEVVTIKCSPA